MAKSPLPGTAGGKPANEKQIFLAAEREQESGGNYQIVNPGSGALGAWQVMPANLPGWLAASGQRNMTPYQYLHDPAAQNRLALVILGGAYDRYGPAGAAAWWYSGQPDPSARYGDPPVYVYVNDVLALMRKGGFPINTGTAPGGSAFNLPPPNQGDWSSHVRAAAKAHQDAAVRIGGISRGIVKIT